MTGARAVGAKNSHIQGWGGFRSADDNAIAVECCFVGRPWRRCLRTCAPWGRSLVEVQPSIASMPATEVTVTAVRSEDANSFTLEERSQDKVVAQNRYTADGGWLHLEQRTSFPGAQCRCMLRRSRC